MLIKKSGLWVPDPQHAAFREAADDMIDKLMREIREKETEILEAFATAYLAETKLKLSEIEMVSKFSSDEMAWTFYFQPRTPK